MPPEICIFQRPGQYTEGEAEGHALPSPRWCHSSSTLFLLVTYHERNLQLLAEGEICNGTSFCLRQEPVTIVTVKIISRLLTQHVTHHHTCVYIKWNGVVGRCCSCRRRLTWISSMASGMSRPGTFWARFSLMIRSVDEGDLTKHDPPMYNLHRAEQHSSISSSRA